MSGPECVTELRQTSTAIVNETREQIDRIGAALGRLDSVVDSAGISTYVEEAKIGAADPPEASDMHSRLRVNLNKTRNYANRLEQLADLLASELI